MNNSLHDENQQKINVYEKHYHTPTWWIEITLFQYKYRLKSSAETAKSIIKLVHLFLSIYYNIKETPFNNFL